MRIQNYQYLNLISDTGLELSFNGNAKFDNTNLFWMENKYG